jgi:hypothetical protein
VPLGAAAPYAVPDRPRQRDRRLFRIAVRRDLGARRTQRFGKTARGKALFILENGQVWRQIDGDSTDVWAPARGVKMKVTISTGIFGSYNLTIEGRKELIKVNRLK